MICPTLSDLPPPSPGRMGWPWTEDTPTAPATMPGGSPWPRITIVTPSYNQAAFIEETVRAVLLQGYPDVEYIVSEDCSTDGTMEVLEPYLAWITLVEARENGGMSRAINRGFERATGEILTWISSDDVYQPGAFETVAREWGHRSGYGVVVGAFQFMNQRSELDPEVHQARVRGEGPLDLTLEDPSSWRLHQVSAFYIREALDDVGRSTREDIRHNPDRELLYRVARRHKLLAIPATLAAFRIHGDSKSWNRSNMLAMADEFARIFLLFEDGGETANRLRRRVASYHRAKGYTKYARHAGDRSGAAQALTSAAIFCPRYTLTKSYLQAWSRVLGVEPILRRLTRGRSRLGTEAPW